MRPACSHEGRRKPERRQSVYASRVRPADYGSIDIDVEAEWIKNEQARGKPGPRDRKKNPILASVVMHK